MTRSGHGFAVRTIVGAVLGHTMLLNVTLKSPATSAKAAISALFMKWISVNPRRRILLTWKRAAWRIPLQIDSSWINPRSKGGLCSKWLLICSESALWRSNLGHICSSWWWVGEDHSTLHCSQGLEHSRCPRRPSVADCERWYPGHSRLLYFLSHLFTL